jgi:hypothetical protein
MAFRDSKTCADNKLSSFYNLNMAVGPGCPNRQDDVMLVQFLLKQFYAAPDRQGTAPVGEMKVDGMWGPTTARWILAFQLRMKHHHGAIFADGRVDPARSFVSSISHTVYTIIWLNGQWRADLGLIHQGARYSNLEQETDAPAALRSAVGPAGDDWSDPIMGF